MHRNSSSAILMGLCALGLAVSGSSCPLVPDVDDKVVELALGGSTILTWEARGEVNDKGEEECFDLSDELDLNQILEDAGVDVEDVEDIALAGVSYRVIKADPVPGRAITNSNVSVKRDAGAYAQMITNFSAPADVTYDWVTATLDPAGVAVVNDMLDDLLAAIHSGGSIPVSGCALWEGESTPVSVDTNFDWQMKIDISIVGKIEVEIPG